MADRRSLPAPLYRVFLSFVLPLLGAVVLQAAVGFASGRPAAVAPGERAGVSLLLAGAGVVSLLLGLRWYGLRGLGLRGHRPLYASIGFASLGWIVFLLARVYLVGSRDLISPQFGRVFVYLLLFEALSVQLWTFGLLFRGIADWRGPLTAAVGAGLVFGAVAFLLFGEAFVATAHSVLYFTLWGLFYGLIRLRTGSILGVVIVQAMQSLTTWHILLPEQPPATFELHSLYLTAGVFYLLFIWRLWPEEEEDYRV